MPLYTVTKFSSIHKTYGLKTIFDQVIDVFFSVSAYSTCSIFHG